MYDSDFLSQLTQQHQLPTVHISQCKPAYWVSVPSVQQQEDPYRLAPYTKEGRHKGKQQKQSRRRIRKKEPNTADKTEDEQRQNGLKKAPHSQDSVQAHLQNSKC